MIEQETVYCVKYALSKGIFKVTGEVTNEGYFCEGRICGHHFLGKRDWCRTLDEAMAAAETLRQNKIRSLEKQLKRVQSMTIAEVDR